MAKRKGRKSSVRPASKVQESDFLARARALAADPALAEVECRGKCILFCPFKRANAHIQKAHAAREDVPKLRKLAGGGNAIGRAYAATLLLAHEDRVGHLAQARLPTGTIGYVYRGNAPPFNLIAMQYYDDPALRLLGAATFVKGRKIHVYSIPDRLITTHKRAAAPPEFVEAEGDRLGLTKQANGSWTCDHPDAPDALVIAWVSAGTRLRICSDCVDETNTVHRLLEHYAGPDATSDFQPQLADGTPLRPEDTASYLKGAFGDSDLLQRGAASRMKALREGSARAYAIGGKSYGADTAAFLTALNPGPLERKALTAALKDLDRPLVIEKPSAVHALAALWPTHGLAALEALTGDPALAKKLHNPAESPNSLAELLARAAAAGDRARIDRELPAYPTLSGAVAFADDLARHHRARGRDDTLRLVTGHQSPDPKERAIALATLRVLNATEGKAWKYGAIEADLAQYLQEPMRALLHGPTAGYNEALTDVARRTGSADPVAE